MEPHKATKMPGKKRKYNVRFSPTRIKKIMQKDTEVGKISTAVPVIISRALEIFLKSLLTQTCLITQSKLSTVVSATHMKQCIESEKVFHFLKAEADRATSAAAHRDNRGINMWPLYVHTPEPGVTDNSTNSKRRSCRDKQKVSSEKTSAVGKLATDDDSSSSEAELFICL